MLSRPIAEDSGRREHFVTWTSTANLLQHYTVNTKPTEFHAFYVLNGAWSACDVLKNVT
jgi:hypothetical protein